MFRVEGLGFRVDPKALGTTMVFVEDGCGFAC